MHHHPQNRERAINLYNPFRVRAG
uniref:Uncharacterized protein n=1 Tax=Anguilla anguilla TaxID=7936 RepID=A0A0E9VUA4_ANGAN